MAIIMGILRWILTMTDALPVFPALSVALQVSVVPAVSLIIVLSSYQTLPPQPVELATPVSVSFTCHARVTFPRLPLIQPALFGVKVWLLKFRTVKTGVMTGGVVSGGSTVSRSEAQRQATEEPGGVTYTVKLYTPDPLGEVSWNRYCPFESVIVRNVMGCNASRMTKHGL